MIEKPRRAGLALVGAGLLLELGGIALRTWTFAWLGLPVAVLGMALWLGTPSWRIAMLAFGLVPIPESIRVAHSPAQETALLSGACTAWQALGVAFSCTGPVARIADRHLELVSDDVGWTLAPVLAQLGWFVAVNDGASGWRALRSAFAFAAAAVVVQPLAVGVALGLLAVGREAVARAWLSPRGVARLHRWRSALAVAQRDASPGSCALKRAGLPEQSAPLRSLRNRYGTMYGWPGAPSVDPGSGAGLGTFRRAAQVWPYAFSCAAFHLDAHRTEHLREIGSEVQIARKWTAADRIRQRQGAALRIERIELDPPARMGGAARRGGDMYQRAGSCHGRRIGLGARGRRRRRGRGCRRSAGTGVARSRSNADSRGPRSRR